MSRTDAFDLLVAAPLREEAAALVRRLGERRRLGRRLTVGRLGGRDVAVAVVGDGRSRASRGLQSALRRITPSRVLVIGLAGALAPDLRLGELVVADHVVDEVGEAVALRWVPEIEQARRGTVVTADRLVDTPEAKRRLGERFGAAALVVDIESAPLVRVASEAETPVGVVRLVSDDRDTALPRWMAATQDAEGHLARGRLVRAAAFRPHRLRTLVRMGRWMHGAAERLADAVEAAIAEG